MLCNGCMEGWDRGVIGDSVHHVAYARHVVMCFLKCGNRCERSRRW